MHAMRLTSYSIKLSSLMSIYPIQANIKYKQLIRSITMSPVFYIISKLPMSDQVKRPRVTHDSAMTLH